MKKDKRRIYTIEYKDGDKYRAKFFPSKMDQRLEASRVRRKGILPVLGVKEMD